MSETNINAVLVRLSISIFSNTRQDRGITDEVRERRQLGEGAGKWIKYKLPDECLEPLRKLAGVVRRRHYDLTCPWEESYRLLSTVAKSQYDEAIDNFRCEFNKLVDEFVTCYELWVDQARVMHGATFDAADYPAKSEIAAYFKVEAEFSPTPRAEHFITRLAGDAMKLQQADYSQRVAEMQRQLDIRVARRVEEAVSDTWNRLLTPVSALIEKLAEPKPCFRDTLVTNITEVLDLIPMLNITGDERLRAATAAIRARLGSLDADALRSNKVLRNETAQHAASLIAQFGRIKRKLAAA